MDNISNLAENSNKYFIEDEDEGKTFNEAKDYLQSEEIYTSKDYQVGLGVLIDNYSKYILMFPTVDFAQAGTVYTLADSGFLKNFLYQGGVKSTVSWIFEDLKFKIS